MITKDKGDSELFKSSQTMQSWVYSAVIMEEVVKKQDHLNKEQKNNLKKILDKHTILFDCKLRIYLHKKFKIEVEEGTEPKWQELYPIPYQQEKVFVEEMINDDILRNHTTVSEWNAPTFCNPKKRYLGLYCNRLSWVE